MVHEVTVHNEGETADEKYLRENPPGEWKYGYNSKDEIKISMTKRILLALFNLVGFVIFFWYHTPPDNGKSEWENLVEYNKDVVEFLKTRFVSEFFTKIDKEVLMLGFFQ